MADDENVDPIIPEFPTGRVKKIMKLDKDVDKVNSEALFLVSCSTQLFLQFLAEKSAQVAIEKKRKIVKLDHMRTAVKRHQPTSDFLLDSLPLPSQPSDRQAKDRSQSRAVAEKPVQIGTRRIDHFFRKPESEVAIEINDS
ncbi:Nuclear transcription factor Y subunit C [Quillaja saponaria]|uniref:Nuclear transcription factor Y subunit C n=1 Tax=Quillaja saponaria TaxID=32244 RepID=A0AAD7PJW7_QUISA|nr:Nuclear transcription factor Y subunit C [Quillaja saponaria]